MKSLNEFEIINRIASMRTSMKTSMNCGPFKSDAEIIEINQDQVLALNIDSVTPQDNFPWLSPYDIGWYAVATSLSDLAAVGVKPLGVLVSWTVDRLINEEEVDLIAQGILDCCHYHDTSLIGGDTNLENFTQFSCVCFGLEEKDKIISRIGAKPGDYICCTGPLGLSNATAISYLKNVDSMLGERQSRPVAQLGFSEIIPKYASSCIDTSDGTIASIFQICQVNGTGFLFFDNAECYDRQALELVNLLQIPSWILAAGEAGEYALIFTLSSYNLPLFSRECADKGLEYLNIGRIIESTDYEIISASNRYKIDPLSLRQLFACRDSDMSYLNSLLDYHKGIMETANVG